jgi:hypothetical protein
MGLTAAAGPLPGRLAPLAFSLPAHPQVRVDYRIYSLVPLLCHGEQLDHAGRRNYANMPRLEGHGLRIHRLRYCKISLADHRTTRSANTLKVNDGQ